MKWLGQLDHTFPWSLLQPCNIKKTQTKPTNNKITLLLVILFQPVSHSRPRSVSIPFVLKWNLYSITAPQELIFVTLTEKGALCQIICCNSKRQGGCTERSSHTLCSGCTSPDWDVLCCPAEFLDWHTWLLLCLHSTSDHVCDRMRFLHLSGRGTEQKEGKRVCFGLSIHLYPSPCASQAELVWSWPLNHDSQVPSRILFLQLLFVEQI